MSEPGFGRERRCRRIRQTEGGPAPFIELDENNRAPTSNNKARNLLAPSSANARAAQQRQGQTPTWRNTCARALQPASSSTRASENVQRTHGRTSQQTRGGREVAAENEVVTASRAHARRHRNTHTHTNAQWDVKTQAPPCPPPIPSFPGTCTQAQQAPTPSRIHWHFQKARRRQRSGAHLLGTMKPDLHKNFKKASPSVL